MRSPIAYLGGKHYLASRIVSLLPRHRVYVEPFCGAAWVLFAKRPSPVETINDIDGEVVNFFRVLRDPALFQEFERMAVLTPYSRHEYLQARGALGPGHAVERAWRFFVASRQGFAATGSGGWAYSRTMSRRGIAAAASRWLGAIDRLPDAHARLSGVQIEEGDAFDVIRRYDTPETLFYCDPPYPASTRCSGGYRHEMSEAQHAALLDLLLAARGMVILSSYPCPMYEKLREAGWAEVRVNIACLAAGRTRLTGILGAGACEANQRRLDVLWRNQAVLNAGLWRLVEPTTDSLDTERRGAHDAARPASVDASGADGQP